MSDVKCLVCGEYGVIDVVDSRPCGNIQGVMIRRRRACRMCGERYSTHEVLAAPKHLTPDMAVIEVSLRKILLEATTRFSQSLKGSEE